MTARKHDRDGTRKGLSVEIKDPETVSKRAMIVAAAADVIKEYTTRLTVRQVYYRLVSKHLIENKTNEYKAVVNALTWARKNGKIRYQDIEDRTRQFIGGDRSDDTPQEHFAAAKHYFEKCWSYFHLPHWKGQPVYVEVWLEKQALAALFEQVTDEWHVRLAPCRGYPSLTYLWEASEHLNGIEDREIVILYFGDFDPSGQDIPRYIEQSLTDDLGVDTSNMRFLKIAITPDQIAEYKIPPMPVKHSDSRAAKFTAEHGEDSAVELDAIDPNVLQDLIRKAISQHFDEDIAEQRDEDQAAGQEEVKEMVDATLAKRGE
jgi:hypothetical protein